MLDFNIRVIDDKVQVIYIENDLTPFEKTILLAIYPYVYTGEISIMFTQLNIVLEHEVHCMDAKGTLDIFNNLSISRHFQLLFLLGYWECWNGDCPANVKVLPIEGQLRHSVIYNRHNHHDDDLGLGKFENPSGKRFVENSLLRYVSNPKKEKKWKKTNFLPTDFPHDVVYEGKKIKEEATGFLYVYGEKRINDDVTWRCDQYRYKNCKAKAIQRGNKVQFMPKDAHTHY